MEKIKLGEGNNYGLTCKGFKSAKVLIYIQNIDDIGEGINS